MKSNRLLIALIVILLPAAGFVWKKAPVSVEPQNLKEAMLGAWIAAEVNGEAIPDDSEVKTVRIISEDYTMSTTYNLKEKQFISSDGGSWEVEGNKLSGSIDFNTDDSSSVGTTFTYTVEMPDKNTFKVTGNTPNGPLEVVMRRIDDSSNDMAGAYRISGRYRGGEMRKSNPGPRKTIKMLSGTRFQWAAINAKTKQFFGTGGGTYTVKDGKYTEHIEFFSRDGSRVGASLEFEASLEGDDWSHQGKSSKGDPIHEIWTRNWNLHD